MIVLGLGVGEEGINFACSLRLNWDSRPAVWAFSPLPRQNTGRLSSKRSRKIGMVRGAASSCRRLIKARNPGCDSREKWFDPER